jgi:hypothetical protein
MTDDLNNIAYSLLGDLINAIKSNDVAALENFCISSAIYEEIIEELDRSCEDINNLTLPHKSIAFVKNNNRFPIDIFEMNDKKSYGVECQLWSDTEASDLTLCASLEKVDKNNYRLTFKTIETQ